MKAVIRIKFNLKNGNEKYFKCANNKLSYINFLPFKYRKKNGEILFRSKLSRCYYHFASDRSTKLSTLYIKSDLEKFL